MTSAWRKPEQSIDANVEEMENSRAESIDANAEEMKDAAEENSGGKFQTRGSEDRNARDRVEESSGGSSQQRDSDDRRVKDRAEESSGASLPGHSSDHESATDSEFDKDSHGSVRESEEESGPEAELRSAWSGPRACLHASGD